MYGYSRAGTEYELTFVCIFQRLAVEWNKYQKDDL